MLTLEKTQCGTPPLSSVEEMGQGQGWVLWLPEFKEGFWNEVFREGVGCVCRWPAPFSLGVLKQTLVGFLGIVVEDSNIKS